LPIDGDATVDRGIFSFGTGGSNQERDAVRVGVVHLVCWFLVHLVDNKRAVHSPKTNKM
jgi:hypothetical protein